MKTVLITGGSSGIGEAFVSAFSAVGYTVAFGYLNSAEDANRIAQECNAVAIRADIGTPEGTSELVSKAKKALGHIDVLINNAAISYVGLFTDLGEADAARLYEVNLMSALRITRAVLPEMIAAKSGRIINISSVWGLVGASCEVDYSVSKAALIGFTKALAKEVAPSGITVNCIAPGVIDTRMNSHLSEAEKLALCEEIPQGRMGTPEEVASLALFLASQNSEYITGQTISPNGGFVV